VTTTVRTDMALLTVNYHSRPQLEGLFESLDASTLSPARILVVDNSPDDREVGALVDSRPEVERVVPGTNLGYGAAINHGVATLGSEIEWIVISNPDIRIAPDAIATLIAHAESDPSVGVAGPAIYDEDGELYPSARALPSLRMGIGHALLANIWKSNPWSRRYHADDPNAPLATRDAGWLSGAFLVVPRRVFDALGGFDASFFMYFEDVDLGRRIALAGLRNVYVPSARVTHAGCQSTQHVSGPMRAAHHASAYRYLARKYSSPWLLPLRLALRAGLAIRAVGHRRTG
jgi:N-acetylglucosaminyl-diphospho-decaprenol L-rhamnosyltransferase